MTNKEIINYTKVKIKEEKLSPVRDEKKENQILVPSLVPSLGEQVTNENDTIDSKKDISPLKSSNEILAELFKVFNAAPPESLLNDEFLLRKHRKRDSGEKKRKKKSKKRGRSSSDEPNRSDTEEQHKRKHKKKKHKRDKKHREHSNLSDSETVGKKIIKSEFKKAPPVKSENLAKLDDESDFVISDEEEISKDIRKDKTNLGNLTPKRININRSETSIKVEKPTHTHTKKEKEDNKIQEINSNKKIVIKNLTNCSIAKQCNKKNDNEKSTKSSEKEDNKRDDSSDLSLSDEETYLREKRERYFKERNINHSQRSEHRRFDHSHASYHRSARDDFRGSRRRSRSRSKLDYRRRSRSRSPKLSIDKKRLLEIARKNAISMFKNGSLPGTQTLTQDVKDKVLLKMRYGGKTVEDLTEFCKKLSQGESLNDLSSLSSNEDSDHDKDGNDIAFHHPFVLKDRGHIVMNIKNATPIPPKSAEQTKAILMQYPVSSGQQHRLNESEWVPVPPKRADPPGAVSSNLGSTGTKSNSTKNIFSKPLPVAKQQPAFLAPTQTPDEPVASNIVEPAMPVPVPLMPPPHMPVAETIQNNAIPPLMHQFVPPIVPPPIVPTPIPPMLYPQAMEPYQIVRPPAEQMYMQPPQDTCMLMPNTNMPPPTLPTGNIFQQPEQNIDVSAIITKRLNAMRRLQENANDPEALKTMYNSQKDMTVWATSKTTPGQFTGSTGANILSAKELMGTQPVWAKRDSLTSPAPLSSGMGMHLLQKMGWRPGEGLGKEKNGSLQPLLLEVKLDKRGLLANEEDPNLRQRRKKLLPPIQNTEKIQQCVENKHPVSLLGEMSAKRKWGAPLYEIADDAGPAHSKQFIFKVIVNGVMYQPSIPSNTKKEAKALAAKYCLQQMGILPT